MIRFRILLIALLSTTPFFPGVSQASNPLSGLDPNNLGGFLPNAVANAAIKTFGIWFAHRPYQGATSIFDEDSFELSIELSAIHLGGDLSSALVASGMGGGQSASIPLPIANIHFRKAISQSMDVGISGLIYDKQSTFGGDVKIVLAEPEEGLAQAVRIGYSTASASLLYLKNVSSFNLEYLVSRKLESAEPYLGVGGRYITGSISIPFNIAPVGAFTLSKSGSGETAYAFTGIRFKIFGPKGLIFDTEGSYDVSGFSSLGILIGLAF